MNLTKPIAAIMILIGLALMILSFINPPSLLQIAGALVGLGFISLGLLQVKRAQDSQQDEERYKQIMARLEQIQREIKETEQPKGTGVAVADIISSGLKYYTEYMTKPKKEETND
ncbi:MAG: hypothetical protein ABID71_06290 [Chloroflexota bacterium]